MPTPAPDQAKRQAKARARGRCIWCSAKAGRYSLCEACRAKQREAYDAAIEASACTRCGGPSEGGYACEACREWINELRRARRNAGISPMR